uniref:Uncharacterized protein n=1 Tax=Arundo donax TaxID=35708 RepID=A0A0A9BQC7_ARUDO
MGACIHGARRTAPAMMVRGAAFGRRPCLLIIGALARAGVGWSLGDGPMHHRWHIHARAERFSHLLLFDL